VWRGLYDTALPQTEDRKNNLQMWRIAAKCWMGSSELPTMSGLPSWKFLDFSCKRKAVSINIDLVKVRNNREERNLLET
jgi:hypothetical protein